MAIDNGRLYAEAQRAIAARDSVLAVVAHDLMNPLAVVLMNIFSAPSAGGAACCNGAVRKATPSPVKLTKTRGGDGCAPAGVAATIQEPTNDTSDSALATAPVPPTSTAPARVAAPRAPTPSRSRRRAAKGVCGVSCIGIVIGLFLSGGL